MRRTISAGAAALMLLGALATSADARPWHRHHGGWGWGGAALGGLAAGAIIGSTLAPRPAYPVYGYYGYPAYGYSPTPYVTSADVAYCERKFKSYDAASGTYLGYDGERHACP